MKYMELKRIKAVKPGAAPYSLTVNWKGGGSDTIDFTGAVHRFKPLSPFIGEPAAFRTVRPGEWGECLEWDNGADMGADTVAEMAAEQRNMSAAEFRAALKTMRLSNNEAMDIFGVSLNTIKKYRREGPAPLAAMACRRLLENETALAARFRPRKPGRPAKPAA